MFSKLRCLNSSAAARGSSWRAKTYLDKTGIEIQNTHHVTGRCFFCPDYQKNGTIRCESSGAHLNSFHVNNRSSRQLGGRLFWEDTKYHVKHEISPVKESQQRRSNLDQRTQGTIVELEKGLLKLSKCQHLSNIVQSYFFSTTSARSVLAPSTVLCGIETDEASSWISRTKTAISGKEEAEESSFMEDPVKNRNDQENPLINAKARCVIETDAVKAKDESFWPLLRGCDTIEEVLTLMEPKIEQKELNIDQYLEVLQRLKIIKYSSLQQTASWRGEISEEMIPGMFVFLLHNNTISSEFGSLGKSSSFQRLQDNLVQFLPEMTAFQYTSCLSSFMWLGVDPTSSTYVRFISHLDDIPSKDWTFNSLHILSTCLNRLPRPDLRIAKYVCPRLKALIEDDCVIAPDRETLFSLIYVGHADIPDIDIAIWLSQQILKIVETSDILKDSFIASWTLKFCSCMMKLIKEVDPRLDFFKTAFVPKNHSEKVLRLESSIKDLTDLVIVYLMDLHDHLTASDVARVARGALSQGIYDLPWADPIKQRSLDLFNDETLPIEQRLQVLVGLTGYVDMDSETHEKIERMILTVLEDADVVSTSTVLEYVSNTQVNNRDLVALCEEKIVQTFDHMMEYSKLSKRLFSFLENCAMQDEDKHLIIQTKLLAMARIHYNHELILKYIMNQKLWLNSSAKVLARLNTYACWFSFRQFLMLLNNAGGWNSFKDRLKSQGVWNGETADAIVSFEKMVAKRYYKEVETNDELDFVINLSDRITAFNPNIVCLETLMRSVETMSEEMPLNPYNLKRLLYVLSTIPIPQGYVSSRVVNRIMDSLDQSNDVFERNMQRMLRFTCVWFSVESEEVTAPLKSKLQDVLQRRMDLSTENRNLRNTVYIIEYLCFLGIFPEAALVDLFDVDTMVKLDRIIAESGTDIPGLGALKEALVVINRCMVIDKADMKIAWFMESYVEEQRKYHATKRNFKDRQLMEYRWLHQILGKGNFFPNWKAECGYTLSFVCLVDKNNNLLPFKMSDFQYGKELGLQRVVVEFIKARHTGMYICHMALKKKHLEKLGYRVVELYEWEYLLEAWSSQKECYTYCREKILGQLSEELTPPRYASWKEVLAKGDGDFAHKDLQLSAE